MPQAIEYPHDDADMHTLLAKVKEGVEEDAQSQHAEYYNDVSQEGLGLEVVPLLLVLSLFWVQSSQSHQKVKEVDGTQEKANCYGAHEGFSKEE